MRVSGTGIRTTVASVLLMGLDVYKYPPFRGHGVSTRRTSVPDTSGQRRARTRRHCMSTPLGSWTGLLRKREEARGLPLRDRLDAQSVVWGIQE